MTEKPKPAEEGSAAEHELAEILVLPNGDYRHQLLNAFIAARPSSGRAHLELGVSYLLNRFSPMLDLPASVIMLGGRVSPQASPEAVSDHLQRAEEHLKRAMELDPSLTDMSTANLAARMVFMRRYEPAISYIEDLLEGGDHSLTEALRLHLGVAYRETGQYDVAAGLLQSLVDSGELSYAHRHLALTRLHQDELAEAQAELQAQLRRTDSEIDRLILRGVDAELEGDKENAVLAYRAVASLCRFDGQHQLAGTNAARREARLTGNERWTPDDYCDRIAN